jgi:hypothetical protein
MTVSMFSACCTARYDSKYDDKKDYDTYSKDSKYEKYSKDSKYDK